MSSVKDIDHGWKAIKKEIKLIKGKQVAVGVLSDAGEYPSEVGGRRPNIAEVATWMEYGVPGLYPARPFMTIAYEKNVALINAKKKELTGLIEDGKISTEFALKTLGEFFVAIVYKTIGESGNFAPNAPATIAIKGSSAPLIDKGRLRQSVTYEVRRKGG